MSYKSFSYHIFLFLILLTFISCSNPSQSEINTKEITKMLVNAQPTVTPTPQPTVTPTPQPTVTPPPQPTVNQSLAKYLTKTGVTMYGAYWCPYCAQQKNLFGKDFIHINYVECDPRGTNPNPALCKEKNITNYPTWEINGKMHKGVHSLQELASLSRFKTD